VPVLLPEPEPALDPPLVLFSITKTSSSWPKIRETGVFCVSVLAHALVPIMMKAAAVSRAFSVLCAATKLKNSIFSVSSCLSPCSGSVFSFSWRGASALAPYSGLKRLCSKLQLLLSMYIGADISFV